MNQLQIKQQLSPIVFHGSIVVSIIASQQQGAGFDSGSALD